MSLDIPISSLHDRRMWRTSKVGRNAFPSSFITDSSLIFCCRIRNLRVGRIQPIGVERPCRYFPMSSVGIESRLIDGVQASLSELMLHVHAAFIFPNPGTSMKMNDITLTGRIPRESRWHLIKCTNDLKIGRNLTVWKSMRNFFDSKDDYRKWSSLLSIE